MSQHFEKNKDVELDSLAQALHDVKEKLDVANYELYECYNNSEVQDIESIIKPAAHPVDDADGCMFCQRTLDRADDAR